MRSSAVLVMFVAMNLFAGEQERSVVLKIESARLERTGNFQVDFFGQYALTKGPQLQSETQPTEIPRKSPWLAAGLSALLPGAGEFYAENYWKAALFLAVDIAAWSLAYSFDKKGDDKTGVFQGYANEHWSVVNYARYSRDNLVPPAQRNQYADDRLFIPGTESRPPWERVRWSVLNEMERVISATQEGKYYSHTLPPYGDQQYYELIGKYKQFNQGWDDAPPTYNYPDPVTPRFDYYSAERGRANDYYSTASTYVTVAVINHILSAVDAAWTAHTFNNSIHASMRIQYVPTQFGFTHVPVARVEYSF